MTQVDSRKLFEDVVSRTGLAAWIGPGAVQRALSSVGVFSKDLAGPDQYRRALPQLRARMAIYLQPEDLNRHIQEIEALLK
jgi:hypothetical protein